MYTGYIRHVMPIYIMYVILYNCLSCVVQEEDIDKLVTDNDLTLKDKLTVKKFRQTAVKQLAHPSHSAVSMSANFFDSAVGITNLSQSVSNQLQTIPEELDVHHMKTVKKTAHELASLKTINSLVKNGIVSL